MVYLGMKFGLEYFLKISFSHDRFHSRSASSRFTSKQKGRTKGLCLIYSLPPPRTPVSPSMWNEGVRKEPFASLGLCIQLWGHTGSRWLRRVFPTPDPSVSHCPWCAQCPGDSQSQISLLVFGGVAMALSVPRFRASQWSRKMWHPAFTQDVFEPLKVEI